MTCILGRRSDFSQLATFLKKYSGAGYKGFKYTHFLALTVTDKNGSCNICFTAVTGLKKRFVEKGGMERAPGLLLTMVGFLVVAQPANGGLQYTFSSPTALFNFATQVAPHGPKPGDVLTLRDGVYYDTSPEATMVMSNGKSMTRPGFNGISWGWTIRNSGFTIRAETPGGVVWSPSEPGLFIQFDHGADSNVVTGLQFKGGFAQAGYNLIDVWGSNNTFSHLYFGDVTAATYVKFAASSTHNVITHCSFEYKPQAVTGPVIWVEASAAAAPSYHAVRYSNFYNMPDRVGNVDPASHNIRLGGEGMEDAVSRTVVEFNVFNGTYGTANDVVLVSSGENMVRYNTFARNQGAMLTVNAAEGNVVYGNYFVSAGGVRLKRCNNTWVYNNYFQSSGDYDKSWPLALADFDGVGDDRGRGGYTVMVLFNTLVESANVHLGTTAKRSGGGDGTAVVFANNVFRKVVNPIATAWQGNLFLGNTEGVTMYNNMYYGTLNR